MESRQVRLDERCSSDWYVWEQAMIFQSIDNELFFRISHTLFAN